MHARLAIVAGVACLLLAGCGAGGHPGAGEPATPAATAPAAGHAPAGGRGAAAGAAVGTAAQADRAVATAVARTLAAGSARTAVRIAVSGPAGTTTMGGEGVSDLRGGRGRMTLRYGTAAAARIEVVYDRGVVYERLPVPSAGDRPWLRLDLSRLLGQPGGNDPAQTVRYLRAASGLADAGRERVRGVPTRRYRATLDLARTADALPAGARAAYLKLLAAQGPTRRPAGLWLDGQGRLRRLRYRGASGRATATFTTEYWDFGVPADVSLPPPDQVRAVG